MAVTPFHILLVALGSALGGIARFWLSGFVARRIGETFPWGTLTVNVSGSAAIGLLGGWLLPFLSAEAGAATLWIGLATGILGSYTTVSSFSLQTLTLLRSGEWFRAVMNAVGSVALCLAAAIGGYFAGQWLGGPEA